MSSFYISRAIGALAGIGLLATAQAAPTGGLSRSAIVAGEVAPVVTQTHGRKWCYSCFLSYGYRHYRPRHYGGPYYGWVAPRRYYAPPYYSYYGYRPHRGYRSGFSIWF